MAEKSTGGPDLMKMLQMMTPYMDEQSGRMLRIMIKMKELQELMQPPVMPQENKETKMASEEESFAERQTMQPDAVSLQDFVTNQSAAYGQRPAARTETINHAGPTVPVLGRTNAGEANSDLAAQLREGLTPEQQSMMASITGMFQ